MKETGTHSFDVQLAQEIGIERALIYKEIERFAVYKLRHGQEPWVYYSSEALAKKFPYMRSRTIRDHLIGLEKDGWLQSKVENRYKYDQTKSFLPNALPKPMAENSRPLAESANHIGEIHTTIPPLSPLSDKEEVDKSTSKDYRPIEETLRDEKPTPKPPAFDPIPCFRIFADPFPRNWLTNRSQRIAAQNLVTEHGLEKVKKAFSFYEAHKHLEFSYDCSTPWDMDSKWTKLQGYRDKLKLQ